MVALDELNKHDLGGQAAQHFSGRRYAYEAPADSTWTEAPADEAWSHLSRDERTKHLTEFFERIKDDARQIGEQFGG